MQSITSIFALEVCYKLTLFVKKVCNKPQK